MSDFSPDQIRELSAPLNRANVKEREQSGRKFSYIEGWHAENEANRIFGYGCWDLETVYERCVSERERQIGAAKRDGWSVSYVCKVRVTVRSGDAVAVREGVGAGHGIDVDLGLAHESAIKEAATDAEKRAFKTFGNPFGLALYDKTQANVVVEPPSRSGAVVAGEASLIMCRTAADFDEWGSKNKSALESMTPEDRAHLVAMWKRGKADAAKSDPFTQQEAA